ncbi:MAG TPA: ABC transporter ATP-binding protein [Candidatus Aquicultor sp.]|jgi:ATP-binding cassette subfamily B protein
MSDRNTETTQQPLGPRGKGGPGSAGAGPGRGPFGGGFGGGHMMAGGKAKDFKGTMGSLIQYMRPFWASIILVLVFAIASTGFAIVSPRILGDMTNQVVKDYTNIVIYDQVTSKLPKGVSIPPGTTGADIIKQAPPAVLKKIPADKLNKIKTLDFSKRPSINFNKIADYALLLIGLFVLSALFGYIQGWIMSSVSQKTSYNFRQDISAKINRMPLKYFDTQKHGDVLSRVTNDVDTVNQTLNQSLTQIVTSITMIIGIVGMMFSISWLLTLVTFLILPLSFGFIGAVVKRSQKHFKNQQVTLGKINGHVEEMYAGHKIVKAFNGEKRSVEDFQAINKELYGSAWKSQFLSGLMWPIMNFIGNLGYVGVAVLGGWLAVRGTINIGDIQAFIQYVRQFNQPVAQMANVANVLQSTAASAERVFEFLGEDEEIPETERPVELAKVNGGVEFDNVVFGYDPEKTVIKGFRANIEPGQRVAIVGPTGAGKTTLVNLLMRFYDVDKGSIKIDGVDIRDMKRADLRSIFGMVLQDTWLFNGTIKENIAYGNLNATNDEIIAAAKAAHVDHFVHSLPSGYDMVLNEEADNISQGEKQLLTIARAMLAGPPILILDEATSSVDTRTELLIQKAMDSLMKDRTSFVIAHRLSTIRDADLILVIDDGNIVEQGNHDELLLANGFYASLYNSQFAVASVAMA